MAVEAADGAQLEKFGNILLLVIFTFCALWQIIITAYHERWLFKFFLGLGTCFELVGYLARIKLLRDPSNNTAQQCQFSTLLIGPTAISVALNTTWAYTILYLKPNAPWLEIRGFFWVTLGLDSLSALLQVAGLSVVFSDGRRHGETLIAAGLASQAASLWIYAFFKCCYGYRHTRSTAYVTGSADIAPARSGKLCAKDGRLYLLGMALASVLLFGRSVYR
jgi:hypothetical protein